MTASRPGTPSGTGLLASVTADLKISEVVDMPNWVVSAHLAGSAMLSAMSCENGECDHEWHYGSPRTLAGALQHGLGRGAREAAGDPAAPDLVMNCIRRDYRWDWQVDEREVYLARLVRDLRLPISPIAAQLFSAPWEEFDKDNAFVVSLGVLNEMRTGVRFSPNCAGDRQIHFCSISWRTCRPMTCAPPT